MKKSTKKLIALAMAAVISCTALPTAASAAWVKNDKGTAWQNSDGTYAKSKWMTMTNGSKYYIKADGTRATGLLSMKNSKGGKDYYFFNDSGVMQTGWQNVKGAVYYFKADGIAATGTQVIGDYAYKFGTDGKWNSKVYSKDGKKDVTDTVDVESLLPIPIRIYGKVKKVTGEKPATVTIKGLTYRTDADNSIAGPKQIYVFQDGNKNTRKQINITNCTDEDLECLKYMNDIEILTLVTYTEEEMKNPDALGALTGNNPRLESKITNLDFCYYMPNLQYVTIYNAPYLSDVSGLSVCKNLKEVRIFNSGIKNLDGLEKLTKIDTFYALYTRLENLNGLRNCKNIRDVIVANAYLNDITGLANKKKLRSLALGVNRRLTDISPLATCPNLKSVLLPDCNWLMDFSPLLEMKSLESVGMIRVSKKSNAGEVRDKLKEKGIRYGIYDPLIYDYSMDELPHDATSAVLAQYWDRAKLTEDVYSGDYKCDCSYCENLKNWKGINGVPKAIIDLGTYKE